MRRDLVLTVHWLDLTYQQLGCLPLLVTHTLTWMCWTYLDLKRAQICGGVCGWEYVCWLIEAGGSNSAQDCFHSRIGPGASPSQVQGRDLFEKRWDDELLREDETRRCGIMRTKSAGNAGFEEWLILREEAVLCYFSCCCRYLLSSPTINNALGGTMSSSLEDYGGLLQIRRGDSFNGGEGLAWKLEIIWKWISKIEICKLVEEVAEKWIKSFKTGPGGLL